MATFREYTDGGRYLIINTGYLIECRLSYHDSLLVRAVEFDHATAREVGTRLLRATGSDSSWDTIIAPDLVVTVADGAAFVSIQGSDQFALTDADVIDLGQRLIVWAGVNVQELEKTEHIAGL